MSISNLGEARNNYINDKFNELDREKKGHLNKNQTYEMIQEIHSLDKSSRGKFSISREDFETLFHELDSDNSGKIDRDEFYRIFEVYELFKYQVGRIGFHEQ